MSKGRKATAAAVGAAAEQVRTSRAHSPEDNFTETDIALRAYLYWEARNREGGSAEDDWFRAIRELTRERLK